MNRILLRTRSVWQPGMAVVIAGVLMALCSGPGVAVIYPFTSYSSPSGRSATETEQNPWGDPWSAKRPSNPDIPVAFATCFASQGAGRSGFSPEEITFLRKLNSPYVFFDNCPGLTLNPNEGSGRTDQYKTAADQLHAANPNLKVLGYHAVTADFQGGNSQFKEEWYIHKAGLPATRENRVRGTASSVYVMDVTNAAFQLYVSTTIKAELEAFHLDGFLDDGPGLNGPLCSDPADPDNYLNPCDDIPASIKQNWKSSMATFFALIKQTIGPKKLHIYNAYHVGETNFFGYAMNDLPYHQSLLNVSDGVWFENADAIGHNMDPNPVVAGPLLKEMNQLLDIAQSLNKLAFFVVNPGYISGPFNQTNFVQQQTLARDFLAFYLTFFRNARTPFIYYSPISWLQVFGGEPYFGDWDIKIGAPAASAVEVAPQVFRRVFSKGEVWWNNSANPYTLTIPAGLIADAVGAASPYTLQPKAGVVLSKKIKIPGDYDGDGKTDISVWRPSDATWYLSGVRNIPHGVSTDIPVPGDYNGDGITDAVVYRPSSGIWYVAGGGTYQWGLPQDIPIPGDYDGDGKTDVATFRPSEGHFHIYPSATGTGYQVPAGVATDIPVPGDYNGDGKTDVAVWRPSNGMWYVAGVGEFQWGLAGDIPVPGDYDGDGKTDLAAFRPSDGNWHIYSRVTGAGYSVPLGMPGDIPVQADYNGDGLTDIAVWRPSNATWYIPITGTQLVYGAAGDIPVVNRALKLSSSVCDLNSDGETRSDDIELGADQALGVVPCTNDINRDGVCNELDLQRIINAAQGGQCVSP